MNAKKINLVFILILLLSNTIVFSQVGIGTASPNKSAMLDVDSTTKGFLPPRLTTTERNDLKTELLITPDIKEKGMLVFDTTLTTYYYWNGIDWLVVANAEDVVDKTNNQTDIAGDKTFTNNVTVNGTLTAAGRLMIPMGEISYFSTTLQGFEVPIIGTSSGIASGNDSMVKIDPGTANTKFVDDMFGDPSDSPSYFTNSTLTYKGAVGRYFHIALSFSYAPDSDKDIFIFGVARTTDRNNDGIRTTEVEDSSKLLITTGSKADYNSTAMHVLLWLGPSDSIEFYVGNITSTNSVFIKSFNFVAIGM